jgi:hypothetical protein
VNDDELITAVRESFTDVRSATPLDQIVSRSRVVRARRRIPGIATVLAAAAATAVVVSAAPPSRHPASGPSAPAPAWTVARAADGSIQVSFFGELRDPGALQRRLRADGIPSSVTFTGQQNPACEPYPHSAPSPRIHGRPLQASRAGTRHPPGLAGGSPNAPVVSGPGQTPLRDALVIHPAALPSGAGVQVAVMRHIPRGPSGPWPYAKGSGHPVLEVGLVKVSPHCTGS